ncbi:Uncharacterized N-acetyltransferase YhbS [Durusdinium trenchii]|uniref:Uncharacterized N-acetyltransferase YhbS n=1 Tax=Durusdinium trenchii TaxID=1381693 RepID=A0ABP0JAK3_9DINO
MLMFPRAPESGSKSDYVPELDLVASIDGQLVGSIVYSKAKIVTNDGLAAELVKQSLRRAQEMGCRAVVIQGRPDRGDPRFYGRLGFRCGERYDLMTRERQWSVGLMAYPLYEGALDGCGGVFEESEAFAVSPEEKRSDDGAI